MDANADSEIKDIRLQEGMRFRLDSGAFQPDALFTLTAGCSAMLGGKPVRCAGFLPGVLLTRINKGVVQFDASPVDGDK